MIHLKRAVVGLALLALASSHAFGAAQVTATQLVSSTRTGRTTYDYVYTISVQNGSPAMTAASATVTSSDPNTVVVKGSVSLGSLPDNGTVVSTDTFTIQQNRLVAFNPAALSWVINGTPVVADTPVAVIQAPSAVLSAASVTLDGTSSGDTQATLSTYLWQQTSGPTVALANATLSQASFVAPQVSAATTLQFKLTVTSSSGATATQTSSIQVLPAGTAQLTPAFVALDFMKAVTTNGHNDARPTIGPVQAGASVMVRATLAGPVVSPVFSLTNSSGASLGALKMNQSGLGSSPTVDYTGTFVVPSVPFKVTASGSTTQGKSFAVSSPSLILPMNMTMEFSPSYLTLVRGATYTTHLQIYNPGADATFTIQISDPQDAVQGAHSSTLLVKQGATGVFPVVTQFPATLRNVGVIKIDATAFVYGDPKRVGSTTFVISLNGAP